MTRDQMFMDYEQLPVMFSTSKCPGLRYCPKVFVINACQGSMAQRPARLEMIELEYILVRLTRLAGARIIKIMETSNILGRAILSPRTAPLPPLRPRLCSRRTRLITSSPWPQRQTGRPTGTRQRGPSSYR